MPESQRFGILRNILGYEEQPHVKYIFGMASYMKENFYNTVIKISEEWDTIPADKNQAPMAASMATQAADRICFKFQTNECVRPKCPFIHKIMNEWALIHNCFELSIKAIHTEGMHHNLLSVHQVCTGGESGDE